MNTIAEKGATDAISTMALLRVPNLSALESSAGVGDAQPTNELTAEMQQRAMKR